MGIVILIADENYHRGVWPLNRVIEVITGSDGLVCSSQSEDDIDRGYVFKTKTETRNKKQETSASTVILTFLIAKLCLLEMDKGDTEISSQ